MHPALPLLVAAALQGLVRPRWRGPVALAGALFALAAVARLPAEATLEVTLLGIELRLLVGGRPLPGLRPGLCGMACLGTLYAFHVRRGGEHAATLVYAASSLGVVFAGDWVTLFLFWEIMAVSSAAVVWYGGGPARARRATATSSFTWPPGASSSRA